MEVNSVAATKLSKAVTARKLLISSDNYILSKNLLNLIRSNPIADYEYLFIVSKATACEKWQLSMISLEQRC